MSPEAKMRIKTSWVSVSCVGLIVTMLGIAYSAGLKTAASATQVAMVNERVDDCEKEVEAVKDDVADERLRSMKSDALQDVALHEIQIQQAVTNNTLAQIQKCLAKLDDKLDSHDIVDP
jgi:hypothetical protein